MAARSFAICDDTYSVISSVLGHRDGCGLVAGTGSSLFVRAGSKGCIHIGGWGYLIDTGGSGYDLGRDAIYMALRSVDGRGRKTVLNHLLEKELGCRVEDAISGIYAGGRPYIASLAHNVFEGRRMGDSVCGEIFDRGVQHLSELVETASQYLFGRIFQSCWVEGFFPHIRNMWKRFKGRSLPSPSADDQYAGGLWCGC